MKNACYYLCALLFSFSLFAEVPSWMQEQITRDLSHFQGKAISLSELEAFYEEKASHLHLVKYTIRDNEVQLDAKHVNVKKLHERIDRYFDVLSQLCKTKGLPDTTLLISINDGLNAKEEMPIFAMCKMDSDRIILLPDYEALGARYQVLRKIGMDVTKMDFPWELKEAKLIWRGSTAQCYQQIDESNLHLFSRVKLCELSEEHLDHIDAKFTLFVQGGDSIPYLYRFQGDQISFKDQIQYKYHILIDGNVCPYSKSGWKLFINSLLFKPDSCWVQWYSRALVPYVHYIPLKADLSDLIEKLDEAAANDSQAQTIASNCRSFALENLTLPQDLEYLYQVIIRYHELNFVP